MLRYRGIPVEEFTAQPAPNFIEVAWLLIFGRLPTCEELDEFRNQLITHELLHEQVKDQFQHVPADAPPMAILSASFKTMYNKITMAVDIMHNLIKIIPPFSGSTV